MHDRLLAALDEEPAVVVDEYHRDRARVRAEPAHANLDPLLPLVVLRLETHDA